MGAQTGPGLIEPASSDLAQPPSAGIARGAALIIGLTPSVPSCRKPATSTDLLGTGIRRDAGSQEQLPEDPDGRRRVVREPQEAPRRVADGSCRPAEKIDGA